MYLVISLILRRNSNSFQSSLKLPNDSALPSASALQSAVMQRLPTRYEVAKVTCFNQDCALEFVLERDKFSQAEAFMADLVYDSCFLNI